MDLRANVWCITTFVFILQAIALTGQRLLGVPIVVQPTQAEKNRLAGSNLPALSTFNKGANGPMRLYVGSLHFNITEDMLRSIFEPFGKIDHMQLMTDTETGRSKGYGFITVSYSKTRSTMIDLANPKLCIFRQVP